MSGVLAAAGTLVGGAAADDDDCSFVEEGSAVVAETIGSDVDDWGRTRGEEKAFEDENWMPP